MGKELKKLYIYIYIYIYIYKSNNRKLKNVNLDCLINLNFLEEMQISIPIEF